MEECAAVAASLGVELPLSIDRRMEGGSPSATIARRCCRTSRPGKPLEPGCMVDAVVEVAAMTGTPAPNLIALSELTAALEQLRDAGAVGASGVAPP